MEEEPKWRIYRNRNARFVYEYLLRHPCVDCGEADPVVLDFDHVRGEKKKGVSRMLSGTHSIAAIEAEIAKCDVRCANCHRRATASRGGYRQYLAAGVALPQVRPKVERPLRHGTETGYRRGCRLPCCRAAHAKRKRDARDPAVGSGRSGVVESGTTLGS